MQPFLITIQKFILRTFSGLIGGLSGTIMVLLVFVLASGIFQKMLSEQELANAGLNPVFLAVFLIMIFLGLLSANCLSPLLLGITDKNNYRMKFSVVYQIFIFNIIIFALSLPFYIITLLLNLGTLAFIALVHSFISFYASHMIVQGMNQQKYFLISIYSTSIGLFGAVVLNFLLFKMLGTINIVLFSFLPICWGMMTIAQGLCEVLYNQFYKWYGVDFLKIDLKFGRDMSTETTETEEEMYGKQIDQEQTTKKDVTGADFLQK